MTKRTESCGRCSVTTVLDAVEGEDDGGDRNPFAGDRIELPERELRRVSFLAVRLGRLRRRLDEVAFETIYRR